MRAGSLAVGDADRVLNAGCIQPGDARGSDCSAEIAKQRGIDESAFDDADRGGETEPADQLKACRDAGQQVGAGRTRVQLRCGQRPDRGRRRADPKSPRKL